MAITWFCKISGSQVGPLSSRQLRAMVAEGRLAPGDPVRQGAEGPWLPAARVQGLFAAADSPATASDARHLPAAKPLAPPVTRPAPERPAAPRVPQAQASPGVPSAPAVARPATSARPRSNPPNIVTEASTETTTASGRTTGGVVSRKKSRNNALVVGLLATLVAGLAIAGIVLAVANSGPRESSDPAAEAASDASGLGSARQRPDAALPSGEPADEKWSDASESTIRRGDVSVRIASATIGSPRVIQEALRLPGRPKRDYLLVAVELENHSADRKLDHSSWGGYGPTKLRATLTDNLDTTYRPKRFSGTRPGGRLISVAIRPSQRINDLLVFDPPAEAAGFLRLRLPAAAFGSSGDLRFQIPWEMIVAAEEPPELQDPGRPQETGVPEIDRGIADLEAEGRRARDGVGTGREHPDGDAAEAPGEDDDPDGDISAINRGIDELRGVDPDRSENGPSPDGKSGDLQPSPQEEGQK